MNDIEAALGLSQRKIINNDVPVESKSIHHLCILLLTLLEPKTNIFLVLDLGYWCSAALSSSFTTLSSSRLKG